MLERCVEANARLDAHRSDRGRPLRPTYHVVDARIAAITTRLGTEVSRLTQERLQVELQRRQATDIALVS